MYSVLSVILINLWMGKTMIKNFSTQTNQRQIEAREGLIIKPAELVI